MRFNRCARVAPILDASADRGYVYQPLRTRGANVDAQYFAVVFSSFTGHPCPGEVISPVSIDWAVTGRGR
jgi:hypothetical protein